jgi:hypothetical protein
MMNPIPLAHFAGRFTRVRPCAALLLAPLLTGLPLLAASCGGSSGGLATGSNALHDGGRGLDATSGGGSGDGGVDGAGSASDTGLVLACGTIAECQVPCGDGGSDAGTTSLSGTVYDPAGKVPLYNVIVYIPTTTVQPITTGASCEPCGGQVTGNPIASTLTDADGHFVLGSVPVGIPIPLVMQLGKWRRQVTLPALSSNAACTTTAITDTSLTRLPRNEAEGDLPQIALTTGGADPLECLLRKVGIDDSEFGTAGDPARVHLYAGAGVPAPFATPPEVASSSFASTVDNGATFALATSLWDSETNLAAYDIVLMACEGQPTSANPDAGTGNAGTKPPAALQAMYTFESSGGRVFGSHWHDYWFEFGPAPLPSTGSWTDVTPPPPDPAYGTIDTSFPKGQAFYDWMQNNGGLEADGTIQIHQPKDNLSATGAGAQQWVTLANPNTTPPGQTAVQYMSFNTPLDVDAGSQCGRVVYSDLHVSSGATNDAGVPLGDRTGLPFPTGCITTDLSPQEKALEFMLFDLSSCIQSDQSIPQPPP